MKIEEALNKKPFGIVGHRGAKGVKPENTISAVKYAIETGVDIIEVDVRKTKDNVLILLHDPDFKRVSGKDIKPEDVEFSYIKEHITVYGEPVATLEEAILTVEGKTGLFIEVKETETTADILEIIVKHNVVDWCAVISFFDEAIITSKELLPSVKAGLIYMKPPGRIFDAKKMNADFVLPYYRIATEKANSLAHRLGLKVVVWTVNDEKTAEEMLKRKADVIATDYPQRLVSFREKIKGSFL